MSQNFGQAAVPLAGLAARALGWRPHDFWQATPAELAISLGETFAVSPTISRGELKGLMEMDHNGR